MIYPFLFENSPELEKLAAVSDILAKYSEWPELYDERQLARNEVPLYAATFVDDMYVNFELAQVRFFPMVKIVFKIRSRDISKQPM